MTSQIVIPALITAEINRVPMYSSSYATWLQKVNSALRVLNKVGGLWCPLIKVILFPASEEKSSYRLEEPITQVEEKSENKQTYQGHGKAFRYSTCWL